MQSEASVQLEGNPDFKQGLDERVRREQFRLLASHLPVVLPGSLLIALMLAWGFWNVTDHTAILMWLFAMVIIVTGRLASASYLSRSVGRKRTEHWLKIVLLAGSFISGCVWGSAGILFFDPENAYGFALLVIVLGGLVAGSLGFHSYYFPNFLLFALPAFLPMTLEMLLLPKDFYTLIGVMMSLFLLLNLFYAKRYAEMIENSIRLQFANDALLKQLKATNRELHEYSYTDPLTGIGNRRQFDLDFEQTWAVAKTTAAPVSLILLDVDHFKEYNDAHGHPQGDEVLKNLALVLLDVCDEQNVRGRPMRIGGEEFALLLKGNLHQAANVAEAIRHAVRYGHDQTVTASLGVAMAHPAKGGSRNALLDAADKALYQAKMGGRDRVICAQQ